MANIAFEARAAFVRAFFVTFVLTLALAPWQHPAPRRVIVSLGPVKRPPVVVEMELYAERGPLGRSADALGRIADALFSGRDVIEPPPHSDADPWPRGMMIYRGPFPDRMDADLPTALDRLLSGLLVPWLSVGS